MNIDELISITDELERINALYSGGYEDTRLSHGKASTVEYITTMRVLLPYLSNSSSVLDLGAGTGVYTIPLAKRCGRVDAVELADKNVELLRSKVQKESLSNVGIYHQSATDLSAFRDAAYDVVMIMGPLYHLSNKVDRDKCIREAMRVCKPNGIVMSAFISNDMVPLTECMYRDFFNSDEPHTYNRDTFQMENVPFVFFNIDQMRAMLTENGMAITREIGVDGVSELMEDVINAMSDASFANYLNYHFYCCEKPEMLGRSNHVLIAGR